MSELHQEKVTSLMAPTDRNGDFEPDVAPPLTRGEFKRARENLKCTTVLDNYPKLERCYKDPKIEGQKFFIHSFVPTRGSRPDEHGVYGFIKYRGTFPTIDKAETRSDYLIKNVDSYHTQVFGKVGKPFPVCVEERYKSFSKQSDRIDIRKNIIQTISEDLKEKKENHRREVQDILDREKKLLEEGKKASKGEERDPEETYIETQVKRAHLIWTYLKTEEKMNQMKESIIQARNEISVMNEKYPLFKDRYLEKYQAARREAGINDMGDNFTAYLVTEPENLGF